MTGPRLFPDDEREPLRIPRPRSTGTTPTAPATGPSLFPGVEDPTQLQQAARLGSQQPPERAARVLDLVGRTGLPQALVERNLDHVEAEAKREGFDPQQFAKTSPVVAAWIKANPTHFALAQDDLDQLGVIEGLAKALSTGFRAGRATTRAGAAGNRLMMASTVTPQARERLAAFEREMAQETTGGGTFHDILEGGAKIYGQMRESMPRAMKAGAVGLLKGMAAGGVAGATAQGAVGYASETFVTESGLSYLAMSKMRGQNGEMIDEDTKRHTAIAIGTVNAALELTGMGAIAAPFAQVAKRFTREVARDALVRPTMRLALARAGKAYATSIAGETATEVAQELSNITGETVAQWASNGQFATILNDADQREQMVTRLADIVEETAKGMLLVGFPGASVSLAADVVQARQAQAREQQFLQLAETIGQSKTEQRHAPAIDQILEGATAGTPLETAFLDVEPFVEYFQSQNKDPREIARDLLGDTAEFDQAIASGVPMAIPTHRFATYAARSTDHAFFAKEWRRAPDEMNAREAEAFLATAEQDAQVEQQAVPDQTPDLDREIAQRIAETGRYRPEDAETLASQMGAFLRTMGERTGQDPVQLLERFGLSMSNGQQQAASPVVMEQNAYATPRTSRNLTQRTPDGSYVFARTPKGALRADLSKVSTDGIVDELLTLLEANADTETAGTLEAELARRGLTDEQVAEQMLRLALGTESFDQADFFQQVQVSGEEAQAMLAAMFGSGFAEGESAATVVVPPGQRIAGADDTVTVMRRAMSRVGPERFRRAAAVEIARRRATGNLDAEKAAVEETARRITAGEFFQSERLTQAVLQAWVADVKQRLGLAELSVWLHANGDIALSMIQVPRDAQSRGTGTAAMRELTDLADRHRARVVLTPANRGDPGGTTSRTRLVAFYKRFGFVENKGRSRDFTVSEGMIRYPRDVELFQGEYHGPRGRIRVGSDRKLAIDLFESADFSTVLHESGHAYLEILRDLAGENEQIAADAQAILAFLGVQRFEDIQREHHEQFARAIEAYFMEGKAPSLALRRAFWRFKAWLTALYRQALALDVTLTPQIRGVFDRMFATDAEIDAAQNEAAVVPLFTTAADAGMSETEFAAYRQTVEDAHMLAADRLRATLMREMLREQQAWWQEQRAEIRTEVAAEIDTQPVYVALSVLQRGKTIDGVELDEKWKLDKADIIARKGAEFLKRLPRPYVYAREGGMDADFLAEQFGFTSGDELLTAIANAPKREQVIEAETDRRMQERHGDLLTDGGIAEEAEAAVYDEQRDTVIRAEMRALNAKAREVKAFVAAERTEQAAKRKTGAAIVAGIPNAETIRDIAQARIGALRIRDIKPHTYWVAARKASRAAIDATASQDYVAAANAKQAELVNLALYREAKRVLEESDSIAAYARRLSQPASQQRLAKAGHDYLDQINGFLERFDFRPLSNRGADRRASLLSFIKAQEAAGIEVQIPEELQNEAYRTPWRELTRDDLTGLRDVLRHLEHLARLKNKLLKAQDDRTLEEHIDAIVGSIEANALRTIPRDLESNLPQDKVKRLVGSFFASHRKLANLVRVMDGLQDGGTVWNMVVRPLNAAGDQKAVLTQQMTAGIKGVFDRHYSKDDWLGMYRKEHVGVLNASLSKMGKLMIALNWGAADNRQKLMAGLAITLGKPVSESQVDAIIDTLDARDLQFVQDVWDYLDSFWPQMKALAERIDGLPPEKIEAAPLKTRHGEFAGGYFPIVYDARQSNIAEQHTVERQVSQMRGATTRKSTKAGSRNERVAGVKMPLRLDFGVIFGHLEEVAMDLAFTETLYDVNRLVRSNEVGAAIRDHYGNEVYTQIKDAIDAIAKGDEVAKNGWEQSISYLRQGMSVATMGWSVMTSAIQPLGLAQSVVRIGPRWVGRGMIHWLKDAAHMENSVAWIQSVSPFMATRAKTQLREINEIQNTIGMTRSRPGLFTDAMLAKATGNRVELKDVEDSFFWLLTRMQLVADVPTWLGQYEKAMSLGASEADAVAQADQAVLDSQGGGQIKDLAGVQRGGPLMKLWTSFYGYFNTTYNLVADRYAVTTKRPASIGRLAVDVFLLVTVPATLTFLLRAALRGDDLSEDEFAEKLWRENLAAFFGLTLGFRELGGIVQGFRGYEGPAGARFFSDMGKLASQVAQGDADEAAIKATNKVAGILFHYPALQVERTVSGFKALADGKTSNPGALLFGAPR